MNHQDVAAHDLVDRYLARTLAQEERDAFEEHFFVCDDCFAAVETGERLRAGVRHLAAAGALGGEAVAAPVPPADRPATRAIAPWLLAAAAVILAAAATFAAWSRTSALEEQLLVAENRSADLQRSLEQTRTLQAARDERPASEAEANLPLAILQTTRAVDAPPALTIPAGAKHFVVWIEDAPKTGAGSAELTLEAPGGGVAAGLTGLRSNDQGAIVASFPAAIVTSGTYTLRLAVGGRALTTYRLAIAKQP